VLEVFVPGLDRRAEYRAARVDLPHHHRDVGPQVIGAFIARGEHFPDTPADFPLQVPVQVLLRAGGLMLPGYMSRTGVLSRLIKKKSQGTGPDRGEHAQPGHGGGGRAVGVDVGENWPEGRGAQQRQHGGGAAITQVVTAAPRAALQPSADTRLEALNLLKVAHQAPPTHT